MASACSRPKACQQCRAGKTKCDMARPMCKTCTVHSRECIYSNQPPKPRPSKALIRAAETRNRALELLLIKLKQCSAEDRESVLASFEVRGNSIKMSDVAAEVSLMNPSDQRMISTALDGDREDLTDTQVLSEDEENETLLIEREVAQYLSVDEHGEIGAFGPTSALHNPVESPGKGSQPLQNLANQLFVNATLQRQFESAIWSFDEIDGVPIELATHLHDLHWNRQHHTFLLTYRPLYTRDLISGGPYWSKFLSNAIFASASKFSNRPEVRDDPNDPRTAGGRFLRRCEELLVKESPFKKSSIPMAVGLMLLSSTLLAHGEVSNSWKYSGLAIRMIFDMGLHLDCERPGFTAEDMEIRRRVFWGIFICDKVQSLYLGRPVTIQLRDAYVSCNLMDTLEENEPWTPYIDPKYPQSETSPRAFMPTPVHSVTCFQQFCELAKLMTRIVSRFYVAGARIVNAEVKLQNLEQALTRWKVKLPDYLWFEPLLDDDGRSSHMVAPNIVLINTTYHALWILLHRPFISERQLRKAKASETSWNKCSHAAKMITDIMTAYRTAYSLRGAPYLASYACYVACTIHVRNAALGNTKSTTIKGAQGMLERTLTMLNELSDASPCALRAVHIIQRLISANQLQNVTDVASDESPSSALDTDAISRMFPAMPMAQNFDFSQLDFSNLEDLTQFGTSYDTMLYDPLFGFMDGFDVQGERS